jgi:hypothetical protein
MAAIVLGSVGTFAAQRPSFAGSWTPDLEKTAVANPGQPKAVPAPRPMAIKQDTASITIERLGAPGGTTPITYNLNNQPMGVDSSKREPNERPAQVRARWEGNTIVLETTRDVKGTKVVSTAMYARDGEWLVVTNTDPDPSGGSKVMKTYYKSSR